ncbi:MAG TPA: GGDEF domain-containing protein [Symbiobacteriaceae bacterium]|nr:GGDEF domain-containing protein [Symbiobacteriaceae bacterium]
MIYAWILASLLLIVTGVLLWERRRLMGSLRSVQALVQSAGQEWESTAERLTQGLIAPGLGAVAFLFALDDQGQLVLQAAAARLGQPVWDQEGEQLGRQALGSGLPALRSGQRLYVPLRCEGESVGLIVVEGISIRSGEMALGVAAHLAAIGLANFQVGLQQKERSNTDGLTGLLNHRRLQQMLGAALGPAYLEGEPLALILLDIDHFKSVNDTYGHLFGDLVLRELSYLLKRHLPRGATAARYGGEEMAILLQGETAVGAAELAERLRLLIEGTVFMDVESGQRAKITISLGVATYQLGMGKQKLVSRADEALYTSKREGRNRVTVASDEVVTSGPSPA